MGQKLLLAILTELSFCDILLVESDVFMGEVLSARGTLPSGSKLLRRQGYPLSF